MLDRMKKFACIIIWYKPSEDIINKWKLIIDEYKENGHFIIVDNTPIEYINKDTSCQIVDSMYICLNQNLGIAEAQNIGIRRALEMKSEYIFFFDQDSEVPPMYFKNMIEIYVRIKSKISTPLILGPKSVSINQNVDYRVKEQSNIENFSIVESVLSSGSVINTEVIEQVGLMMSSLFIDQVDHEYCYRAGSKNVPTVVCNEVILHHQIGNKVINLLGINFIISAPFRYYYQFRNSIVLLKLDYVKNNIKCKIVMRKIIEFFIQPVLNYPNSISVLKNIVRGVKDGLKYKIK